MNKDTFFGDLSDFDTDINYTPTEISLKEKSSQILADIIVSNRYLNILPELAKDAMILLSERRISGEVFEYENYIESKLKDLPQLNDINYDFISIIKKIKV